MESLGVNVNPGGRHRTYERILRAYAEQVAKTGDREPCEVQVGKRMRTALEVRQAMYEAHEIYKVFRGLREPIPEGLQHSMSKMVKGPDFYPSENVSSGTNQARNFGLELAVGADMRMLGYGVFYGDDSHPEPLAVADGLQIAFQCKRMSSDKASALQDELKDAAGQLAENRTRLDSITHGVVVVDLTKLVNPSGGTVSVGRPGESYPVRDELHRIADSAQAEFATSSGKQVDGMIFRATYPVRVEGATEVVTWVNHPLLRYGKSEDGKEAIDLMSYRHVLRDQARAQGRDTL